MLTIKSILFRLSSISNLGWADAGRWACVDCEGTRLSPRWRRKARLDLIQTWVSPVSFLLSRSLYNPPFLKVQDAMAISAQGDTLLLGLAVGGVDFFTDDLHTPTVYGKPVLFQCHSESSALCQSVCRFRNFGHSSAFVNDLSSTRTWLVGCAETRPFSNPQT